MIRPGIFTLIMTFCIGTITSAMAAVTVHPIFDDNMVLQRNNPINIWGRGTAGEAVTVTLGDKTVSTSVNQSGQWSVKLPAREASTTPQILKVNTKEFKNVLIGDVWILGGQSNMRLGFSAIPGDDQTYMKGLNVRIFKQPEIQASGGTLSETDYFYNGYGHTWEQVDPSKTNTVKFSAIGLYFGSKICKESGVPIGLVLTAIGGSKVEAWTPIDALKGTTAGDKIIAFGTDPKNGYKPHDKAGVLYEYFISGITPLTIGGYFWYQGEANSDAVICDYYEWNMKLLIDETRKRFVNAPANLPFMIMQVHPWAAYGEDPAKSYRAVVRDAQYQAFLTKQNTGFVNILDCGDGDIHSSDKKRPGLRAGTQALVRWYGKKIPGWISPFFAGMSRSGDKVRISFDANGTGLKTTDGQAPRCFYVRESSTAKFTVAEAKIVGNQIELSSSKKINEVRYAWIDDPKVNLVNEYDLPVGQFKSDLFGPVAIREESENSSIRKLTIVHSQRDQSLFDISGRKINSIGDIRQRLLAPGLYVSEQKRTPHINGMK